MFYAPTGGPDVDSRGGVCKLPCVVVVEHALSFERARHRLAATRCRPFRAEADPRPTPRLLRGYPAADPEPNPRGPAARRVEVETVSIVWNVLPHHCGMGCAVLPLPTDSAAAVAKKVEFHTGMKRYHSGMDFSFFHGGMDVDHSGMEGRTRQNHGTRSRVLTAAVPPHTEADPDG